MIVKTKKERINGSLVYTTTTACPDGVCQKAVDSILDNEKVLRDKITENQVREKEIRDKRRMVGRKKALDAK